MGWSVNPVRRESHRRSGLNSTWCLRTNLLEGGPTYGRRAAVRRGPMALDCSAYG